MSGIRECPQERMTVEPNGRHISCSSCGGAGMRTVWSFGVKEPDECPDCGGSGRNWLYPRGAIARYYGGPFLGSGRTLADAHSNPHPTGEKEGRS